jgi:hypothetical protein
MAQWIRRLPTEQEILGSSPSTDCFCFDFQQKRTSQRETRTLNLPVNSRARCRLRHPGRYNRSSKRMMRQPGVEPGAKAWEASMLPIHHWRTLVQKGGGAGFRSLCLPIANRPLYRVSYTPSLVDSDDRSKKKSARCGARTRD